MATDHERKAPCQAVSARAGGFLSLFPGDETIIGLAPMAGFTEAPFRSLCAEEGASFTVTELVSARGIRHDRDFKRSARYLLPTGGNRPWGIQLFGFDPGDFAYAVGRLLSDPLYSTVSFIDLNMGCPAPKVVRDGAGAALMRTPALAARIVEASVKAAEPFGKMVTVKMRSGFDRDHVNAPDIARIAEQSGASAVTVHARTRDQYYSGDADWQVIRRVREMIAIPLLGNGDLADAGDLVSMRRQTGCDGFQIGRAARGNPFIFSVLRGRAPAGQWLDVMTRHLNEMISLFGERTAVLEMRSHFAFYLRGFNGAASLRRQIMKPETPEDVLTVLKKAAECREAEQDTLSCFSE